jgi:hypothetical protein
LQSTNWLSAQLACCLARGFPFLIARPRHTLLFAPRSPQLHRRTVGASPGIGAEQGSQPDVQESFPLNPAHFIALAVCTNHAHSLRNVDSDGGTDHHILNRPKLYLGHNIRRSRDSKVTCCLYVV